MVLANITRTSLSSSFMSPVCSLWTRRELLFSTVKVSLKQRFAGSVLGLLWLVLGPVLLLTLYAMIYLVVFQVRPQNMEPAIYVLYIFSGLIPLINFSQGLMMGTTSLSADKDILLNTVYPAELVPMREVCVSLVTLAIGICLVGIASLTLQKFYLTWLLVPFVMLFLLMFLTGITWVLSLANLVLKDIQQLLTYVTILLLVASPIAYTPDMIPASLQVLIYFNPLAYFVICFQNLIVLGQLPDWPILTGVVLFAVISILFGAYVFSKAKTVFFDYA